MSYKERLIETVINNSISKHWDSAVLEWEITGWDEASSGESYSCICGKEDIIKLFTITNYNTNISLEPIGSKCIKRFGRTDLMDETSALEKMFDLQTAYENNEFIELNSKFFSRKSLEYMYKNGAFRDTEYGTAYDTYQFLLDMFNKRSKPTPKQQRKIKAHIMSDIRPYCKQLMIDKVKK